MDKWMYTPPKTQFECMLGGRGGGGGYLNSTVQLYIIATFKKAENWLLKRGCHCRD